VDNKRKGSSPPSPPKQSGRSEWNQPSARTFDLIDDDDGPLPAPPDFDGQAGRVPELIDGDEGIIDDAEVIDDGEVLDSALVTEVRASHLTPPPIPAPMPSGTSSRSFIDDGEIALPPQISRYVQNFPFRKVRAAPDPIADDTRDDGASPDTAGWRSAALNDDNDDDDTEELEPDELEPDELESDELESDEPESEPPRPPPVRAVAPSEQHDEGPRPPMRPVVDDDDLPFGANFDDDDDAASPARTLRLADQALPRSGPPLRLVDADADAPAPLHLVDDDDEASDERSRSIAEDATEEAPAAPVRAMFPVDDDDAPLFADTAAEPAPMARAEPAPTEPRWRFADLDGPRAAPPSASWSDDEPASADMFGAQLGVEPETAPVALGEASRDPARMFSDETVLAADTITDGEIGEHGDPEATATGMYRPTGPTRDSLTDDDEPPRALELPDDDDDDEPQHHAPPNDDDDDDEPQRHAPPNDDDEPQHRAAGRRRRHIAGERAVRRAPARARGRARSGPGAQRPELRRDRGRPGPRRRRRRVGPDRGRAAHRAGRGRPEPAPRPDHHRGGGRRAR
jgi:hypothetical protein